MPNSREERKDEIEHTQDVGTILYMSPEQIAKNPYDYKVDIFALGIILFELLVPLHSASERIEVLKDLQKRKFPSDWEKHTTEEERKLINSMLHPDPAKRPKSFEIHFMYAYSKNIKIPNQNFFDKPDQETKSSKKPKSQRKSRKKNR